MHVAQTTYHPDVIEALVNLTEERAFHLDIIQSFENRGWALYEFGNGQPLTSYLELQYIVEMGRETRWLKHGIRYLLLPLNEQDSNWPVIRDLFFMIISQGRGPYFVDLEEHRGKGADDGWVEPIGSYLIDSVVLEPPFLNLIIDPNMSRIKDPERIKSFKNLQIPVHISELHIIRKQIMKALRVI